MSGRRGKLEVLHLERQAVQQRNRVQRDSMCTGLGHSLSDNGSPPHTRKLGPDRRVSWARVARLQRREVLVEVHCELRRVCLDRLGIARAHLTSTVPNVVAIRLMDSMQRSRGLTHG